MNKELDQYLDGELDGADLQPDVKQEAEVWNAFLRDVRESGAQGAPVGLESLVLNSIQTEKRSQWPRIIDWWIDPHAIRIRPLIGLAAAAVLAVIFLLPKDAVVPVEPSGAATTVVDNEVVYVQFKLEAPEAKSVAVAGDFNEWVPGVMLADPDGDGVWVGRLKLSPGVHRYMYVIDGSHWITDPYAERYTEDGFGRQNAVIAITGGAGARSLAP